LSYPPENSNLTAIKIAEKENNTPNRRQYSCQEKGLHNLSGFSIESLPLIIKLSLQGNQFDIKIEELPGSEFDSRRELDQNRIPNEFNSRMRGQSALRFRATRGVWLIIFP
jgi:hypothetical protein